MTRRQLCLSTLTAVVAVMILLLSVTAGALAAPKVLVVADGVTATINETTYLNKLVIGEGSNLVAKLHYSLTLTVNGVEMGQAMAQITDVVPNFLITTGSDTAFLPGTYLGDIVLTVAEENLVEYKQGGGGGPPPDDGGGGPPPGDGPPPGPPPASSITFPFRQALYLDENGVDKDKSVLAAVTGKKPSAFDISNIIIRSRGECFDGIFVAGGKYNVTNVKIDLKGNGRSDFVGYGAAVVARGEDTTLVVDKARITTEGVVRSGVVADKGANVIVKNSYIQTNDGVLPPDYFNTIDTTQMRDAPWMLGLRGTTRATNLLGEHTQASYVNSYVGAEGWGVLSTDGCVNPILTAINSTIAITGKTGGYGSYVIGGATEYFYGCTFNVSTYANIFRGGVVYYNDSTKKLVGDLNKSLPLGLTAKELKAIPVKPTVVNSENWGAKWHGDGTVNIAGGTVFNTGHASFLVKNQNAVVNVDGSGGARFKPADGILYELIDNDDVGPGTDGNNNVYQEPTTAPVRDNAWDLASTSKAPVATFSNVGLAGDFYNSVGWTTNKQPTGKKNLVLNFNNATLTGVISATQAHHEYKGVDYPLIDIDTYYALGHLANTVHQAVNNGVIVNLLDHSVWTVDGTSYVTKLALGTGAKVVAPAGHTLTVTVDPDFDGPAAAAEVSLTAGSSYTGYITLTVN